GRMRCGYRRQPASRLSGRVRRRAGIQAAVAAQASRAASPAALPPAESVAGRPHVLRNRQAQGEEEAMKYFTRELKERYGSPDDAVADAANAEWETALERYEQYLASIADDLPGH